MRGYKGTWLQLLGVCILFFPQKYLSQVNILGQETSPYTVLSTTPFLLISPDARAGGMGEVGVATSEGEFANYWNPSALDFSKDRMGVGFSYIPWLRNMIIPDINYLYLSAFLRSNKWGAIGMSFRRVDMSDVQFPYPHRYFTGSDKDPEMGLDISYAKKVSPHFSLGASLRGVRVDIQGVSNNGLITERVFAYSFDLSATYKRSFSVPDLWKRTLQFSSSLVLANLGPKMPYTLVLSQKNPLPSIFRWGYALTIPLGEKHILTLSQDLNKLMVPSWRNRDTMTSFESMFRSWSDSPEGFVGELREISLATGLEYGFGEWLFLRTGYFHEHRDYGERQFLTFGLGGRYKGIGLDISFLKPTIKNHPLDDTWRFSLTYRLR